MTRALSSAIKTQLASSSFVMAHLVKLELNATFRFTDFSSDISVGSGDYVVTKDCNVYADNRVIKVDEYDSLQRGMTVTSNKYGIKSGSYIQFFKGGTGNEQIWMNQVTETDAVEESHSVSFTVAGVTEIYTANRFLLNIGNIKESSKLTVGSVDLQLSAVNQTLLSDFLNNGHLNKKVTIYRAFINASTNALIEKVSIFSGRIEGMDITDNDKESIINVSVANHWSDFNRRSGRRTTSESQQQYFPADLGFDFITLSNLN